MKLLAVLFVCLLAFSSSLAADGKRRPMTLDDLFRFQRVSDPQVSPDGRWVVYVLTTITDKDKNQSQAHLWLAGTDGTPPRQLTTVANKKDRHPRWSPDGTQILFESNRSGESQLWLIDIGGGEARQLTTIASEASSAIWSRDSKSIAFVSAVYPEYSEKPFAESNELNKKRKDEIEKNPVKAKVFTRLFYRHWDSYVEDKRQHLFVMPAPQAHGSQSVGLDPRDVTPGDRDAYPTSMTFESGENFTFSPDGTHLIFTAVPEKNEAWSTNYDLCRVPVAGGSTKWECLTKANAAADNGPVFSPDGKRLAYRAQMRAGFEADRWQLLVVDVDAGGAPTGKPRSITADLDRSVDAFVWRADSNGLRFLAEERGTSPVFEVSLDNSQVKPLLWGGKVDVRTGTFGSPSLSQDGKTLVCTVTSMNAPAEVLVLRFQDGEKGPAVFVGNVSRANEKLLAELDLPRPESVTVPGANSNPMQMWILKPPGFDPAKKWPLAYIVHGGPQGAWDDNWSYRWNPELWAAQGYVVALPNPRGSTGFGQKYVDEISTDWGGKCYDDLMTGLVYLEKQPWIDTDRMAAAGASFGGYMMNWFQGKTTKFKTLITHCGVYNHESMYATTEEIWFDEWEHGEGKPLWENRAKYVKHSPHLLAKDFKTPMLIIHNDLDFRVPVSQGHELFTTLQRLGVASRFVNFPDEGHWVLKPKNSEFWHKEVFAWLAKYAPPGGR